MLTRGAARARSSAGAGRDLPRLGPCTRRRHSSTLVPAAGGALSVDRRLKSLVDATVLRGTHIGEEQFWAGLSKAAALFPVEQREGSPAVSAAAPAMVGAGTVTCAEYALPCGPLVLCPIVDSRSLLRAVNARWGSLLDAASATNAAEDPSDDGHGAAFGACHALLDEVCPLKGARWDQVTALTIEPADTEGAWRAGGTYALRVETENGAVVRLLDGSQLAGFKGMVADGDERALRSLLQFECAVTEAMLRLEETQSVLLSTPEGPHIEIEVDRRHRVGATHRAGFKEVSLESAALSVVCDVDDGAYGAADKVAAYSSWLDLMKGEMLAPAGEGGGWFPESWQSTLTLPVDRTWASASPGRTVSDEGAKGEGGDDLPALQLRGGALLLGQTAPMHTHTATVLLDDAPVPAFAVDAAVLAAAAVHDLSGRSRVRNVRQGAVSLVVPGMSTAAEVAHAAEVLGCIEEELGLPNATLRLGVWDGARGGSLLPLEEWQRAAGGRLFALDAERARSADSVSNISITLDTLAGWQRMREGAGGADNAEPESAQPLAAEA